MELEPGPELKPEPGPEPEAGAQEDGEEVPEFGPEVLKGGAAVASLLKKAKASSKPPRPDVIEDRGMEHEVARPYDFFDAIEDQAEEHPVHRAKRKDDGA